MLMTSAAEGDNHHLASNLASNVAFRCAFSGQVLSDTDSEGEEEQDIEEKMRQLKMEIRKKVKAKREVYNNRRVEANARLSMLVNEISGLNRGIKNSHQMDRAYMKKQRTVLLNEISSVVTSLNES